MGRKYNILTIEHISITRRDLVLFPSPYSLKACFHWRRSCSRSRNQKLRAYDLVKTAFRFCLRLGHLRSAYDLVKTRFSESEVEAEELNQSQRVAGNVHCDWFILPLLLPTPKIWFSLDHSGA